MYQGSGSIVETLCDGGYCDNGYARSIPFGCVDRGLLSVLYFLPGQSMAPHRHLDSDEYFTAIRGGALMLVEGEIVPLPQGHTFLRLRGMLHALNNPGPEPLIVQSFQTPIPQDSATVWEDVDSWGNQRGRCPRCWCGQTEGGQCINCGTACD